MEDVRVFNGEILGAGICHSGDVCLVRQGNTSVIKTGQIWDSCRLVFSACDVYLAGCVSDSSGINTWSVIVNAENAVVKEKKKGESRAFSSGDRVWLEPAEYAGYFCFSRTCLCSFGGDWYKALTPKNGCSPILMKNGMMKEIEMNGYLTGVEVAVIPTS